VLESFTKCILRDESRSTTNVKLTEKIVALLIDRSADVTRIPRQLQAVLLDELKIALESKVCRSRVLQCWEFGSIVP